MNPRATVAIILALAVALPLTGVSGLIWQLISTETLLDLDEPAKLEVVDRLMFAIIGALSGYIAGKADGE